MWTRGVPIEDEAKRQLANAARLPIVFKHIAAMPDVHFGIGATVGSVIPTVKAIIPAAVGVDIGCGMIAAKTTLRAEDLPDNPGPLRSAIERAVPHGRAPGARDPGAWGKVPGAVDTAWAQLEPEFTELCRDYPKLQKTNNRSHLGTLGSGNHFIEVCLDEAGAVWFMLHSGRAAWATPSARCSSSWPRRTPCAATRTCRTATSPTSRRAADTSATTSAPWAGRRSLRT
jgi:tRNA-splicing ligase RtcB (3'-phosphate/5'-hydroxy nucleic acid ligase)